MGKKEVLVKDETGFIFNRLLSVMMHNSVKLYEEEQDAREIDESVKAAMGMRMGPLEMSDFLGLDFCLKEAAIFDKVTKGSPTVALESLK